MNKLNIKEFINHIQPKLDTDDDLVLWNYSLMEILNDLDSEFIWDETPTPNNIHLVIAKQSNWWKPHFDPPALSIKNMYSYESPDWELHWDRNGLSGVWNFHGKSIGKQKGKTIHCFTFFPGHTVRHSKANIIQIWKPPISPGFPVTKARKRNKSWYPNGKRYLYIKNNESEWSRNQ